jgi:hyperosmotically inducible periplasmic protein
MIRGLLKLIVLIVVVAIVGAFLLGYDIRDFRTADGPGDVVGTAGSERAQQAGAEIRERAATAADATKRAVADGALTSKIKAKMALDDSVKALDIDVDTTGGVVTLRGTVHSDAERQRAVALARETDGVSQVVDRLQLK